jgi:pyruvate dehydrogenase (quinone)
VATQEVPYIPAAEFAELLGLEGIKVTKPEDVGPAWDRALAATRPVLLEFICDPNVPPLPPHVKPQMLKETLTGLMKEHNADAASIAAHGFRGKLTEFTEHAKQKLSRGED